VGVFARILINIQLQDAARCSNITKLAAESAAIAASKQHESWQRFWSH